MPEFDFVLDRDVPDLKGKVLLITGGMHTFVIRAIVAFRRMAG